MKVYIDKQNMKLLGVEKERPFYTGDSLASNITVYFNNEIIDASVTLSFLLSNGRTPRSNLVSNENGTVTIDNVTWYYYTWNLNATEGILTTPGPIQMTLSIRSDNKVEQLNFTNNVVKSALFGNNKNVLVLGDNPDEVIDDLVANIYNLDRKINDKLDKRVESLVVDELPEEGENETIYYVKQMVNNDTSYDCYVWNVALGTFVFLGTSSKGLYTDDEARQFQEQIQEHQNEFETEIQERLDSQDEQIQNLGELQPSGVDTSTNILAKSSADGIWIGSDTGYWYYWNGTQYVSGGVYISSLSLYYKELPFDKYFDGFYDANGSYYQYNTYRCIAVDTQEGEKFRINGKCPGSATKPIMVLNSSGSVIDYISNGTYTNYVYTVPANASKIEFSFEYTGDDYASFQLFKVEKIFTITDGNQPFNLKENDVLTPRVQCWGDSLTAGAGASTSRTYPDRLTGYITGVLPLLFKSGYFWEWNGSAPTEYAYSSYSNAVIDVQDGDVIEYTGTCGGGSTRAIIARNGNTITGALGNGTYTNELFTVPTGSTKVYVTCQGDSFLVRRLRTSANGIGDIAWNYGVGGENSSTIAFRQGALPVYVKPTTLIGATDRVEIEFESDNNKQIRPCLQGYAGLNNVYIAGVWGQIWWADNKYWFQRTYAGDAVVLEKPTKIYTKSCIDRNNVLVIWTGTNDGISMDNVEETIKIQKLMIKQNGNDKYLVLGLTMKDGIPDIEDVNGMLADEYGDHFVDIRKFMINYGLDLYKLHPTAQDAIDIANGEIPSSLRSDHVHGNDYFYDIVAQLVYDRGKELGYWK